jgi:hypothetical protein
LRRSRSGRCQQKAAGKQGGGGAKSKTHVWVLNTKANFDFSVRPQDFGSPTATPLLITSQAHKPEQLI